MMEQILIDLMQIKEIVV